MIFDIHSSIKSISSKDLIKLKEIDEEGLNTWIEDPFTFNICICWEKDKILGFGLIRIVNEFRMCLNEDSSNYKKAKVIKELMGCAIELSQCNEILVEISKGGPQYTQSLINRGFKECDPVLRREK